MKSKMRWVSHVACIGAMRSVCKILVRNLKRKDNLVRPTYRWEMSKWILNRVGEHGLELYGSVMCSCEHDNEPFGSIEDVEFFDEVSDC
jgi:hypothetical protein